MAVVVRIAIARGIEIAGANPRAHRDARPAVSELARRAGGAVRLAVPVTELAGNPHDRVELAGARGRHPRVRAADCGDGDVNATVHGEGVVDDRRRSAPIAVEVAERLPFAR